MKQIVVAALPKGPLTPETYRIEDAPPPVPRDGEVRLRVILMSIDAANRSWLQGATYRAPVLAGDAGRNLLAVSPSAGVNTTR